MDLPLDPILILQLILFALLMGCSAFFSGSETSLFSLNPTQLEGMRQTGHPRFDLIHRMLQEPRRLIVTILIGNELVNVAASNISATLLIQFLGGEEKWWINILVMLPILLLVGEITPKTIAVRNNIMFASFVSRPLQLFARLITPVRFLVRHVSDYLTTLIVGESRKKGHIVTEDMVRTLATQAAADGLLDNTEREFIQNIFEFGDQQVGEVMTPRSNMFSLSLDTPLPDLLAAMREKGFSRVPIHRGREKDAIVGILHIRDLLGRDLSQIISGEELATLVRKPFFVPETRLALDLFHTFRERKQSIALVVDEYGGIAGLVSMDDLLQIIFGELGHNKEGEEMKPTADGHFVVEGGMPVESFNEQMDAELETNITQTMGGLLLHLFGELPAVGAEVTADHWRFRVTRLDGARIAEALAMKLVAHPQGETPAAVTVTAVTTTDASDASAPPEAVAETARMEA